MSSRAGQDILLWDDVFFHNMEKRRTKMVQPSAESTKLYLDLLENVTIFFIFRQSHQKEAAAPAGLFPLVADFIFFA